MTSLGKVQKLIVFHGYSSVPRFEKDTDLKMCLFSFVCFTAGCTTDQRIMSEKSSSIQTPARSSIQVAEAAEDYVQGRSEYRQEYRCSSLSGQRVPVFVHLYKSILWQKRFRY